MAISVKQKFKAIGVILSVLLIIAVVVWLAAEKSTEPQFENKVDKLLFDTDNKSPKYIITLPDKTRRDFVEKTLITTRKRPTNRQKHTKAICLKKISACGNW